MKKTFYITTPIYYPSGELHIGHVYTTTLAWVLKNYKKLQGYDAKLLTGADEHGQKILEKANEIKISPQMFVDQMSQKFQELWKDLHIDFDYYSRTTNLNHKRIVQNIFSQLHKKKLIYKGQYEGLYSVQDEEFVALNQAIKKNENYYHPVSLHILEKRKENSYFLKVSAFQKWLQEYLKLNPFFILPSKRVKELNKNFLEKKLEDLSISRPDFKWGVPIKEDPNHVIYVWLDALINYISALGYSTNSNLDFKKYWEKGAEIVHVLGKEISRFHCIYWPIVLESLNLKQPTTILSHGWILSSQGKMSKSKNNVISPKSLILKYGFEEVKYFFAAKIPFDKDGIYSQNILETAINTDLVNNFGNLHARTMALIFGNFSKPLIFQKDRLKKEDLEILKLTQTFVNKYKKKFNQFQISEALTTSIALSKKFNNYVDTTKPWTLKEDKERLAIVLNTLLQGLYAIATMLCVVLPKRMQKLLLQFQLPSFCFEQILNFTKFDNVLFMPKDHFILFHRIK